MSRRPVRYTQRLQFYGLVIVCVLSGSVALLARDHYERAREDSLARARTHALSEMHRASQEIEESLTRAAEVNRALVERLEEGPPPPHTLREWIVEALAAYPHFFGVGVAYRPNGYTSAPTPVRLFAPYYARIDGVLEWADIDYDYEAEDQPWYDMPMALGRPVWQEPRFAKKSQTRLASYTAPFFHASADPSEAARPDGVVFTTLSAEYYRDLLRKLELGRYGYGFILSRGGLFVAHPDQSYVESGKTIAATSVEEDDPVLAQLWQRAQDEESGSFAHEDPYSGRSAWLLHQRISVTEWTLVIVFSRGDLDDSVHPRGRIIGLIASVVFALGIGFLVYLVLPWSGRAMQRVLSFYATLVLLGAAASILYSSRAYTPALEAHMVELTDPAMATEQVSKLAEERAIKSSPRQQQLVVPTGVFVSSIRFSDANDVEVSGYIWQRYGGVDEADVVRGLVLPEAVAQDMEVEFEDPQSGFIRWRFSATLRQSFDYRYFPFDYKTVWVRMQPRDRSGRVLLVPDFSSYLFAAPHFMPGLDPAIVTADLQPVKTVFCASVYRLDTNLGDERGFAAARPELYFNMLFRRHYAQSVINYFVPMLVVTLLIFGVLLSTNTDDEENSRFGFSFFNVLQICASLFFVISVAHIDLRARVPQDICYAEIFYFLMYPMILWLALHTMAVVDRADPAQARAISLRARLYFGPIVSALVFTLTVWVFRDIV